ncbi:MAG: ELM1/GtrOC1 family putative glycosyltransferase [Gammaproteobacteria bacterium]|nr:ELM1/GtrOC1 family putative glycosyltransferase [Gammaproteobacteria bacterium]
MASAAKPARAVQVWRFADGLRGHENQSDGLIEAIAERTPVAVHTVHTPRARRLATAWRTLVGADTTSLPSPQLLVGAGSTTHLPMLVARRRRGGRVVVLMKPSLPLAWFDLVLAPAHDDVSPRDNLLVTRGAINRVRASAAKDPHQGLMLVGGPDRRHAWEPLALEGQISAIASRHPEVRWCAASSRRTPAGFLARLRALGLANLETVDVADVDAEWLPRTLATAATVWVTEDSVSMLYEALTAGAATGLLELPKTNGRAARTPLENHALVEGLVTPFAAWQHGAPLAPPRTPLDEAGRCAELILERWPALAA